MISDVDFRQTCISLVFLTKQFSKILRHSNVGVKIGHSLRLRGYQPTRIRREDSTCVFIFLSVRRVSIDCDFRQRIAADCAWRAAFWVRICFCCSFTPLNEQRREARVIHAEHAFAVVFEGDELRHDFADFFGDDSDFVLAGVFPVVRDAAQLLDLRQSIGESLDVSLPAPRALGGPAVGNSVAATFEDRSLCSGLKAVRFPDSRITDYDPTICMLATQVTNS